METTELDEVFDLHSALSSVGGDKEFLSEVVGLTQAAWPTLIANIQKGMSREDLPAVQAMARLAKAAAPNVSARRAYESALELEMMACKGDLPAAREGVASLEREVEILQHFLATLEDDRCLS